MHVSYSIPVDTPLHTCMPEQGTNTALMQCSHFNRGRSCLTTTGGSIITHTEVASQMLLLSAVLSDCTDKASQAAASDKEAVTGVLNALERAVRHVSAPSYQGREHHLASPVVRQQSTVTAALYVSAVAL